MSKNQKIIQLNQSETDSTDEVIEIKRTETFKSLSVKLGKYIQALPLTTEQNDTLVGMIVENVLEAERGGFQFGSEMMAKLLADGNI